MPIGSLIVELSGNVARFSKDMEESRKVAEEAFGRINELAETAKTALGAVGAIAGLGLGFEALKERIEATIETTAGLERIAQQTGSSIENLANFEAVAKLSGGSTEQLSAGLQRLSRSMIEAQTSGSKTAEAFHAIGISTSDIAQQKPDEVFRQVALRLNEYQDGATKVAVAQALFGKSGAELLPVLKDLATNGDLSLKVTQEQAEAAEQLEKNEARLKLAFTEAGNSLIRDFIPGLTALTAGMLEAQKSGAGLLQTLISFPTRNILASITGTGIQERIDADRQAIERMKAALEGPGKTPEFLESTRREIKAASADLAGLLAQQREAALSGAGDLAAVTDQVTRRQTSEKAALVFDPNAQKKASEEAKAALEAFLRDQQKIISSETALVGERNAVLTKYYQDDKISISDYFAAKRVIEQEGIDHTKSAYDAEIAAIEKYIAKADDEKTRLQGRSQLVQAQDRENQALQAGYAKLALLTEEQAKADEQYAASVAKLNEELLKQEGRLGELARLQVETQDRQIRARATVQGDTGTLATLDTLERQKVAQGQINELTHEASLIEETLANTTARVSLEQQTGQITELQALAQTDAARRAQIDQLEKLADDYKRVAQASGDPQMLIAADTFKLKIDQLAASTDSLGKMADNVFQSAFTSNFEKVISGTESIKKAFQSMASSIEQQLSQIASKDIAQALFGGSAAGGGAGGTSFGMLGGLFGGLGSLLGLGGGSGSLGPGQAGPPAPGSGGLLAQAASWIGGLFADGGQTNASQAYIVGESGPEMFVPGTSGTVVPAGGFGGHTININLGSGTAYTRDSASQLGATIARHLSALSARNN